VRVLAATTSIRHPRGEPPATDRRRLSASGVGHRRRSAERHKRPANRPHSLPQPTQLLVSCARRRCDAGDLRHRAASVAGASRSNRPTRESKQTPTQRVMEGPPRDPTMASKCDGIDCTGITYPNPSRGEWIDCTGITYPNPSRREATPHLTTINPPSPFSI